MHQEKSLRPKDVTVTPFDFKQRKIKHISTDTKLGVGERTQKVSRLGDRLGHSHPEEGTHHKHNNTAERGMAGRRSTAKEEFL